MVVKKEPFTIYRNNNNTSIGYGGYGGFRGIPNNFRINPINQCERDKINRDKLYQDICESNKKNNSQLKKIKKYNREVASNECIQKEKESEMKNRDLCEASQYENDRIRNLRRKFEIERERENMVQDCNDPGYHHRRNECKKEIKKRNSNINRCTQNIENEPHYIDEKDMKHFYKCEKKIDNNINNCLRKPIDNRVSNCELAKKQYLLHKNPNYSNNNLEKNVSQCKNIIEGFENPNDNKYILKTKIQGLNKDYVTKDQLMYIINSTLSGGKDKLPVVEPMSNCEKKKICKQLKNMGECEKNLFNPYNPNSPLNPINQIKNPLNPFSPLNPKNKKSRNSSNEEEQTNRPKNDNKNYDSENYKRPNYENRYLPNKNQLDNNYQRNPNRNNLDKQGYDDDDRGNYGKRDIPINDRYRRNNDDDRDYNRDGDDRLNGYRNNSRGHDPSRGWGRTRGRGRISDNDRDRDYYPEQSNNYDYDEYEPRYNINSRNNGVLPAYSNPEIDMPQEGRLSNNIGGRCKGCAYDPNNIPRNKNRKCSNEDSLQEIDKAISSIQKNTQKVHQIGQQEFEKAKDTMNRIRDFQSHLDVNYKQITDNINKAITPLVKTKMKCKYEEPTKSQICKECDKKPDTYSFSDKQSREEKIKNDIFKDINKKVNDLSQC